MVVLDQDAIVETDAVIRAASHAHRVFLQKSPAGSGLSRVEDFGSIAARGGDELPRRVAIPLSRCRKLRAVRSAARMGARTRRQLRASHREHTPFRQERQP